MELPRSKTKIGSALVGIGAILGIVGNYLLGSPVSMEVLSKLFYAIGGVAVAFGIRDLPFVNKE